MKREAIQYSCSDSMSKQDWTPNSSWWRTIQNSNCQDYQPSNQQLTFMGQISQGSPLPITKPVEISFLWSSLSGAMQIHATLIWRFRECREARCVFSNFRVFRAFVPHHHVLLELGRIIARETAAVNSALEHFLPSSISSPFDKHGDLKRKGLASQKSKYLWY